MTDMNASSGDTGLATGADDDAAPKHAAAEIRRQRPGWVVIWVARTYRYNAWPLFRGTALTAEKPDELTTQMDQIEQAIHSLRPRSRRPK